MKGNEYPERVIGGSSGKMPDGAGNMPALPKDYANVSGIIFRL